MNTNTLSPIDNNHGPTCVCPACAQWAKHLTTVPRHPLPAPPNTPTIILEPNGGPCCFPSRPWAVILPSGMRHHFATRAAAERSPYAAGARAQS